MRAARWVLLGAMIFVGCEPGNSGQTDSGTATSGATSGPETTAAPTSSGGDTTGAPTTGGGVEGHGACPNGDECALCVEVEGGSVCGPECLEFGPGPAAGRCPESPFLNQTICTLDTERAIPGGCLITCAEDADCPGAGMVCVACPEPYAYACGALWGWAEVGPNMCVWPTE